MSVPVPTLYNGSASNFVETGIGWFECSTAPHAFDRGHARRLTPQNHWGSFGTSPAHHPIKVDRAGRLFPPLQPGAVMNGGKLGRRFFFLLRDGDAEVED